MHKHVLFTQVESTKINNVYISLRTRVHNSFYVLSGCHGVTPHPLRHRYGCPGVTPTCMSSLFIERVLFSKTLDDSCYVLSGCHGVTPHLYVIAIYSTSTLRPDNS